MFVTRVTVYPEIPPEQGGGFLPGSFDHLMHLEIHQPGLDPTWEHTLVEAHVAEDRASADLVLNSTPKAVVALDRHLRVVTWTPAAYIRAHDQDGNVVAEIKLNAPLTPGELVEVGGVTHRVAPAEQHELWPHRHPDTGVCRGSIDWQHVTVVPEPQPPHHPVAREVAS